MTTKAKRQRETPKLLDLNIQELEELIARARSERLLEEDCAKLEALIRTLAWLQRELAQKDVTLARLRRLFGMGKTEKTATVVGKDAQAKAEGEGDERSEGAQGEGENPKDTADSKEQKTPDAKPKGHGRNGAAAYTGAEHVEVPHDSLKPGDRCPACTGKVYRLHDPRCLVRIVGQAPLMATVYELETLRCNACGELYSAEPPAGVGDEKHGPTVAAAIGTLKYGLGMPFNRLERLQTNLGIPMPAATQWEIVRDAAAKIAPEYEELIRQAADGQVLHNDDTSMEVLELRKEIDERQASGEADSERTGIFSTSIVSELEDGHRVALFITGPQHAGENITDVLRNRAAEREPPVQMCDALDRNYPKEFETIVANCLVHARRNFVDLTPSFPAECRHVLEALGQVYKHDADARKRGMSAEERLSYHQAHSGPLMESLEKWMAERIEQKEVEPNSALGGAIDYMHKRWERFTLFLRKAGAPLDNNICEQALKKVILHRKNALFYKTMNGARVGDIFMSLIHTAELARANTFHYLTALIEHAVEVCRAPGEWLPWNYAAALERLSEQRG
jgi:hypothetical protein